MSIKKTMSEFYDNRTLLYSMIIKEIKGKYRSARLGPFWHILTPLSMVLLYYVVFGSIMYSNDSRYWVYIATSIFPYIFFQTNMAAGAVSVVVNGDLIKKKYFPRYLVVLAEVLASFIVFIISFAVILVIFFITGIDLDWKLLLLLPPLFVISFFFALGYALALAALTVFVRDIQHFIDTFSRVFFWITPIFYHYSDISSQTLQNLLLLNPLTYFIESYHSLVYYSTFPEMKFIIGDIVLTVIALVIGVIVFRKYQMKFAEEL